MPLAILIDIERLEYAKNLNGLLNVNQSTLNSILTI